MPKQLKLIAVLFTAVLILGIGGQARANSYTFCASMDTAYTDSGIGEDYLLSDVYVARYLEVRILDGTQSVVHSYLDQNGCISFTYPRSVIFTVEFYGRLRIPRSDNSAYTNMARIRHANGSVPKWIYYWTFGSASTGQRRFTFQQTRRTNLINVTRWALERFSDGLVNKNFDVWDKGGCSEPENSCNGSYSGQTATIFINPQTGNSEKFLIAHELGHGVIAHWFNDHPGHYGMYNINDGGPACTWTGFHALHSKEYSSAALTEGFAQYYATYVFNNVASNAWFHYYKQEYKNNTVQAVNMEGGPTGGQTAYLDNVCTGTKSGRGIELDWARQLWDYRTNSGVKPSNYILLRQIKNALASNSWTNTNTWARMRAGIQAYDSSHGTDFWSRWDNTDTFNGINH